MKEFGRQTTHIRFRAVAGSTVSGFTILELLVTMGIIALLAVIFGTVAGTMIGRAREKASAATINKIQGLLDQRFEGFGRYMDSPTFQTWVDEQHRWLSSVTARGGAGIVGVSRKVSEVLKKKYLAKLTFPQRFAESPDVVSKIAADSQLTFIAANHNKQPWTESSELLYYVLTKTEVFGIAPVDDSEFSTSEVADTDDDGLLEFVDAWGQPLRFYRWPTRLVKPTGAVGPDGEPGIGNTDDDGNGITDGDSNGFEDPDELGAIGSDDHTITAVDRNVASLLMSGLPAPPRAGSRQHDMLNQDPGDELGLIAQEARRLFESRAQINLLSIFNEANYHTIDTYHAPLIVSAGADNRLGLFEPFPTEDLNGNGTLDAAGGLFEDLNGNGSIDTTYGHLAMPTGVVDDLTDNITNRNQRAGGK